MREIERKMQWCPHRRLALVVDQPGADIIAAANARSDNSGTIVELGTCIGQGCSQWRWDGEGLDVVPGPQPVVDAVWVQTLAGRVRNEPPRPAGLPASYIWGPLADAWVRPWVLGLRHGHCGLAGPAGPD